MVSFYSRFGMRLYSAGKVLSLGLVLGLVLGLGCSPVWTLVARDCLLRRP